MPSKNMFLEGVTTIPKGSRVKRPEAQSPWIQGEEIVCSAWEHAAAPGQYPSVAELEVASQLEQMAHKLVLNRYMRTSIVFGIDPDYVSVAFLDGIKMEDLAKTGDAEKKMLITEFCLVADNPDAHFKIQNLPAS